MSSTVLENMKRTAEAVLDGYRAWEIEAIMKPRTDDCVHQLLPKSLGRPGRDNKNYREYFATVANIFKDFKMWSESAVYDTENRKAALHLFCDATTPIGQYQNEYSFFLTYNTDGTKVCKMDEMIDSAYGSAFFGRLHKYMEEQGKDAKEAEAAVGELSSR